MCAPLRERLPFVQEAPQARIQWKIAEFLWRKPAEFVTLRADDSARLVGGDEYVADIVMEVLGLTAVLRNGVDIQIERAR